MKKIIMIDDNTVCLEGIFKNIKWEEMGATVCGIYASGIEALKEIEKIQPDIVISDIQMPEITGIDLAKTLLTKFPFIKIIFISSYDDFIYAQEAIRLNICDYVEKPIDYDYLTTVTQKVLRNIQQEKETMEQLKHSQPILKEKFFLNLINAGPTYAEYMLQNQASYLNLQFTKKQYICVYLEISKHIDCMNSLGVERYHLNTFQLIHAVEDYFYSEDVYTINQGGRIIFIVGHKQYPHKLSTFVMKAFETIKKQFDFFTITIGIGHGVQSIWEISNSYRNAKKATEYKFIFGDDNIYSTEEIHQAAPTPLFLSRQDEELLINLISKKDKQGIKEFLAYIEKNWSSVYYNKNGILSYISSILSKILRFLYEVEIKDTEIVEKITHTFSILDTFNTVEEVCENLEKICLLTSEKIQQSIHSKHNQIAEQIIQFIENHYNDITLNLNTISNHINMSPSYVGSIFKKIKNTSISKYITFLRINKAKEFLSFTSIPIMEISEKVGYSNQYYFSASFKKVTGLTPTEYRTHSTIV